MKITVQTVSSPAEGEVDITLRFSGVTPATAGMAVSLGQMLQSALADGKVTPQEALMFVAMLGSLALR